jgi:hypothetical protein
MTIYQIRKYFVTILFSFLNLSYCSAQEPVDSTDQSQKDALKIFLDCSSCDRDYSRKNLTFVNFVRDPADAQVHIYTTSQRMANGGQEFTINFIGKDKFIGINDTLVYTSQKSDTPDIIRQALVNTIKLGLIRYAAHTPIADQLSVKYSKPEAQEKVVDKWNYWLFSLSGNGMFSGEKLYTNQNLFWSVSANRITTETKINLSYSGSYYEQKYYDADTVYYSDYSRSRSFSGSLIFSIDDHWSWGFFGSSSASTYSNLDFGTAFSPAIEYNIFPYNESTRRVLRLSYRPTFEYADYHEETIYDKKYERLFSENISLTLDQKEPWGSASISLHSSHYFHDIKKSNVGVFSSLTFRVVEGLSVNFFGDYTIQRDQLSLAKSGATDEEVLLRRKEQESNYSYWMSVGLSYSFGSIFNNIVNPRFGSSGGGGYSISYSSD